MPEELEKENACPTCGQSGIPDVLGRSVFLEGFLRWLSRALAERDPAFRRFVGIEFLRVSDWEREQRRVSASLEEHARRVDERLAAIPRPGKLTPKGPDPGQLARVKIASQDAPGRQDIVQGQDAR